MRKLLLTGAAAAAILATGSVAPNVAAASPLSGTAGLALDGINMAENVAWCFYIDGWNGPGWYRCGYRLRRGLGWHGARDSAVHTRRESRRGTL
jgi:hypothetical protein